MPPALSPCQSLPIFLCYSWSIYSSGWGGLTPILFVSVSLFCLTSSPILSVLPLVPSWPLLSGGYSMGLLKHPIEFLLWECFVRSVSFRGPPSSSIYHTIPASLGRHLPVWVKLDMSASMCVCVQWCKLEGVPEPYPLTSFQQPCVPDCKQNLQKTQAPRAKSAGSNVRAKAQSSARSHCHLQERHRAEMLLEAEDRRTPNTDFQTWDPNPRLQK